MPKELKLSPIQPKMFVTWTGHDEDVPATWLFLGFRV